MRNNIFGFQLSQSESPRQSGMTLLEMILAMVMLIVFTSIVVLVTQVAVGFFGDAGLNADLRNAASSEDEVSAKPKCSDETIDTLDQPCVPHNGILIDQQEIRIAMDALVEVLSQPGINVDSFALPLPVGDAQSTEVIGPDDCSSNPKGDWLLPMPDVSLPLGYQMCLWKTLVSETPPTPPDLPLSPGIYMLQALPNKLGPSGSPVRRLFCRPRPYC